MFPLIFFLIVKAFLSNVLRAYDCFSFENNDSSICYTCNWTHFYNGTLLPFLSSECQQKQPSPLSLKFLILSSDSLTSCSECALKSIIVQKNLFSALFEASDLCRVHLLCEVVLYLEPTKSDKYHIFMTSNNNQAELLRRLSIKLTIQPLFCGILSAAIPCIQEGSNSSVKVLFKAADIKFFISDSLYIRNLVFDCSDMNYANTWEPCWNISKCCTDTKMNTFEDACYIRNKQISSSVSTRSYGLFNLELIVDNPIASTPALIIEACKFVNLYVAGYGSGFTALVKSAGYSFFNLTIQWTSFENVFFLESIISTANSPESLISDPVYKPFKYNSLMKIVLSGFVNVNSTSLSLRGVSVTNYNNFSVIDLKKAAMPYASNALLFELKLTGFKSVIIEDLLLKSIRNQTRRQLYIIALSSERNDTLFMLNRVTATDVQASGFLYLLSTIDSRISNINLNLWIQYDIDPIFNFQNLSLLAAGEVYLDSILAKIAKSPAVQFSNCLINNFNGLYLRKTVGLTIEISMSTAIQLAQVSIKGCQYGGFLFYAEASIFVLSSISITGVEANDVTKGIIFSFRSPLFNLSSIYINSISAEAVFDYRDAQSVYVSRFLMENITGVRTFFLISVTFHSTELSDLTIQNSVLPRFAEFLNGVASFMGYTPTLFMVRATLLNLTLPALNADLFAAFLKIYVILRDSLFINVKRVDMGPVAPFGIIYISRMGSADLQNCSFLSSGYTFRPRSIQAPYNFPLVLISYLDKYSMRYCVFESDDTVSINSGLLVGGFVKMEAEVLNCKFFARKRNPDFIYKGVLILHSSFVNFINNSFSNLSCTPYHFYADQMRNGPITIFAEETLSFIKSNKKLELHNNSFENCNCENGGAFHFSNYHIVNISNMFFQNSSAISGGTWGIISSSSIIATNITILFSYALEAASLLLSNIVSMNITKYYEQFVHGVNSGSWKVSNSEIFCNQMYAINTSSETYGGFSLLYDSSLELLEGILSNNSAKQYGGTFFTTFSSILIVRHMLIENSFALYGGFLCGDDAALISLMDSMAISVEAQLNGALIYIDLVFRSLIHNFTVKKSSTKNGVVYIKTTDEESFHNISQLFCDENYAQLGSCIYFRSSSGLLIDQISITRCYGAALNIRNDLPFKFTVKNLNAIDLVKADSLLEIYGLTADIVGLTVSNCSFIKYALYFKSSNVTIKNLGFFNSSPLSNNELYLINTKESNVTFTNLNFFNFKGKPASLLISQLGYVSIKECLIEGGSGISAIIKLEKSPLIGVAIVFRANFITCIAAAISDIFLKDVEFMSNYNGQVPSCVNFKNQIYYENSIILQNVTFVMESQGLINSFSNFKTLNKINCTYRAKYSLFDTNTVFQGSLIADVQEILLTNSSFTGFKAYQGAAARISASKEYRSKLTINNSIFSYCTSLGGGGGAISFINIDEILISNSYFFGNQALVPSNDELKSGIGGSGLISCQTSKTKICSIILKNNSFTDNFASLYGPLFIANTEIEMNSVSINKNNTDGLLFSNSTGSFPPKAFISLPNDEEIGGGINIYSNNSKKYFELSKLKVRINIKSGKGFSLDVILTDNNEQILTFDNKSTCSMENPLFAQNMTTINNGFTVATKGKFTFSELSLLNIPNTTAKLLIVIKIPKELVLNSEAIILSNEIDVYFNPCVKGEIILSDFSCLQCGPGKFSYIDPMLGFHSESITRNTQKCEVCSEKAICPGGQYDYPRPTFWRPVVETTKFLQCLIPEACEGPGTFSELDQIGKCAEGHSGNLCNDCIHGYGKLSVNSLCDPCSTTKQTTSVRLFFSALFLFLYVIGSSYTYSVQDGEVKKHGFLFVYIKIGLNFSQIVSLLTFIKFTWVLPSLRKMFSTSSSSISFLTEEVLLNDCLIQDYVSEIEDLYAIKVIIIVFLPILLWIVVTLFWIIFYLLMRLRLSKKEKVKKLKNARKVFYIRLFASFIISIFLFHPLIIKSSFNMLNCFLINEEDPNSDSVLFVYPSFRCWSSFHYKIVFLFALPGITIWGFLFPSLLMFILVQQQNFKKRRKILGSKIRASIEKGGVAHRISDEIILDKQFQKTDMFMDQGSRGSAKGSLKLNVVIDKHTTMESIISKKKNIFDFILKSNIFEFLCFGYNNNYSYWECFHFLKKFLISLLINLHQIIGFDIIVLLLILTLTVSLLMQYKFQPFITNDLNFLENFSCICTFLVFVSIAMLSNEIPTSMLYFFGLLILLLYFVFSLATAFYILKTIKETSLLGAIWASFRSNFTIKRSRSDDK